MSTTTLTRKYAETHPWITFQADLNALDHRTWLLLGEAQSKCEHIAGAPLRPEIAVMMHLVYLSKGIHGTTSIEGNTLSEDQVRQRIEGDLDLPVSREYQGREIDNILKICNELGEEIRAGQPSGLSVEGIHEFNRRILEGLPLREGVVRGETRTHSVLVGLGPYRGAPAEDCDYLLEKLVDWLNGMHAPDDRPELRFPIAVLKAVLAHLYLAWIHPFGDGNGRTARMIEFQLMIEAGAPSPALHLLSNHYNLTRDAYLVELQKTSTPPSYAIDGFVRYALQGFVDQLREQIDMIRKHQLDTTWENYVHDQFRNEETPAKRRQRHLVLDMPNGEVIQKLHIPDVSNRLAREYAGKDTKTLTRDINELLKKKLLVKTARGYKANRDLIKAFLPMKVELAE